MVNLTTRSKWDGRIHLYNRMFELHCICYVRCLAYGAKPVIEENGKLHKAIEAAWFAVLAYCETRANMENTIPKTPSKLVAGVKAGQFYLIAKTELLEPGTSLVNWLHAGGIFLIKSVRKMKNSDNKLVKWVYSDYGNFNGKEDSMPLSRFNKMVASGLVEILK
jgi:hypothetical protein